MRDVFVKKSLRPFFEICFNIELLGEGRREHSNKMAIKFVARWM